MTPRSIFLILLKVLGIFLIKDIMEAALQVVFSLLSLTNTYNMGDSISTLIISILILAFYTLIAWYLLFKSNLIIDRLKLDEGFDEDRLNLHISLPAITTIAIIVTATYILIQEIPNLCRTLFAYYQQKHMLLGTAPDWSYTVFASVKIIIALLLIGERKRITTFIEKRSANNENV